MAYHDALDGALRALEITLAPEARDAIDGQVRLLIAWNAAINLTAIRDPAAIAIRHVVDSLTGLAVLRRRQVDRFVDLGSGGGFPGIPLAAALPADRALLIDSIGKKVRFLATAVAAIGLADHVAAEAVRSESLAVARDDRGRWPAVTARAVAPLAELVELSLPLLVAGGILVAWKRAGPDGTFDGEVAAARRALTEIDGHARLTLNTAIPATRLASVVDVPMLADLADHRLVVVERSRDRIADLWPRDPTTRRRQPW